MDDRVVEGHEDDEVTFGEVAEVLDHELGGGRVGELGEDHDERATLELLEEHVHAEHVVGLGRIGRERREGAADARELAYATRERRPGFRGVGVGVDRDEVAGLERDLGEQRALDLLEKGCLEGFFSGEGGGRWRTEEDFVLVSVRRSA